MRHMFTDQLQGLCVSLESESSESSYSLYLLPVDLGSMPLSCRLCSFQQQGGVLPCFKLLEPSNGSKLEVQNDVCLAHKEIMDFK